MPTIDDLLRSEGETWRAEIDTHHEVATVLTGIPSRRLWSTTRARIWTVSVAGVAAAAVLVLAVGLGAGSGESGSSGSSTAAPLGDAQVASRAAGASVADPSAGAAAGSAAGAPAASGSGPVSAPSSPAVASTALILTGSVAVTVRSNDAVDRAATLATGIADGAGGRVDADTRTTSTTHSATLVLRVPNAALPGVTKQLAALGSVRSQNLQTRDVTAQVADVNSRVISARAAIAGLTRLYARARSVGELIAVESALAGRQSDLEALEAQQRTLAAQTGLATLTLSVDVQAPATKHRTHHGSSGFVDGLHRGWHAFTHSLRALATGLGAVLPFLVVVLVVSAAGLLVVRRRRPPQPTASSDPDD